MKLNTAIGIGVLSMMIAACGGGGSGIKSGSGGAGGTSGSSGTGGSAGSGGTCKAGAACGGDIEGTWEITSSCMIGDITAMMADSMGTLPAACNDLLQNFTVSVAGNMTFANGTLSSNVIMTLKGREHVTPACMTALGGTKVSSISASTCSGMEDGLAESDTTSSVTCTAKAGNCDCDLTSTSDGTNEEHVYALSGNQVVDPTGEDGPMDYCVAGNTLTLIQTSSDLSDYRLVLTLLRK